MAMNKWHEMALTFLINNEENATVETVRLLAQLLESVDRTAREDVQLPKERSSPE